MCTQPYKLLTHTGSGLLFILAPRRIGDLNKGRNGTPEYVLPDAQTLLLAGIDSTTRAIRWGGGFGGHRSHCSRFSVVSEGMTES